MLTTLRNGLAVIEALADGPLAVRDIAARTAQPRQTAYRLTATLVLCGWVIHDPATDTYRLSRRAWSIGTRSLDGADLRDTWASTVRALAATGETVHLAVYERGEVVYIDKAEGEHPVRAYTQLGGRAPAHCVATGKVLLAHVPVAERERVLRGRLVKATRRSITDPRQLAKQLAKVVVDGFATNLGEWRDDVGGVAVPIRSETGAVVAALGFSAPAERLVKKRDELLALLGKAVELDVLSPPRELPAVPRRSSDRASPKPASTRGLARHFLESR